MLTIILILVLFHGSSAVLVNQGTYGDTILKYYNEHDDSVNTAGAISRCAQRGGRLVMPKDCNLNSAVRAVIKDDDAWIGVGDFGVEGAYEFIDGSRIEWSNWDSGEPNNYGHGEDCVIIRPNKRWNDFHCELRLGYVCQFRNSRSLPFEHSHVRVYQVLNKTTYAKASTACERAGRRLVKVKDDRSAQTLLGRLPQRLDFPSWINIETATGETTDRNTCFSTSSDGEVASESCDAKRPFICESVEPHKVIVSEEAPVVAESSDLEISCSAYGFPTPDVTWFHGEIKVKDQVRRKGHATMKLHGVSSTDAGLYTCLATNVINNQQYKMEGYSVVKVTSKEGTDYNKEGVNDEMY